ncbi:response regulator [Bradyrhizobium sp. 521_C7_N1_3]|uniref:response regulator n=1 Tax=Bradyrhizobium sp. 521_C7_N1_3 TaxID=3240368 RepID=UPI003F890607
MLDGGSRNAVVRNFFGHEERRKWATSQRLWSLEDRRHIVDDAPRILVVEDEYLIALELDTELRAAGYRVIGPVADIEGALELLKVERPDAAILDVNLAGRWVTPVAETLRSMSVPFILASGYVAADLRGHPVLRDAANVGKSWRSEYLLETLRSALGRP